MSDITIPNTLSDGNTILASEHNQNYTAITDVVNGNIDNDNIAPAAAIAASKLAISNILNTASTISIGVGTTGDTNPRIALDTDGHLVLGSGSAAGDVRLIRESAGVAAIRNAANNAYEDLKCDGLTASGTAAIHTLTLTTVLSKAYGGLGFVPDFPGNANKVIAVNSGETALELQQAAGGSLFKPAMITETIRTLPTSGNISGIYVMKDVAWSSTGTLTATGPTYIYANGGSFTLGHTLTATAIDNGGVCTMDYDNGQDGGGLGGGQGGAYGQGSGGAGGGSPAGSDGGKGGSATATYLTAPGRGYGTYQDLCGSGGGAGGSGSGASQFGAPGGGGGSSVVLETYNCNVAVNEDITVNGGNGTAATNSNYDGSGGGGGGGSIIVRLGGTGTFILATSKKLQAKGGNGGAAGSTEGPGGPGAGGYVDVTTESATLTINGSIDVSAGTKGTGGTYPATNGEAGSSSTASSTKPISIR